MSVQKNMTIPTVVPAYNEEEVLPEFHKRTSKVLNSLDVNSEIIYVNDGSNDKTSDVLIGLNDESVAIIELSRNHGKEIAMSAGLDYARSDAVVVIDANLQDPPELIPDLIDKFKHGYDVISAKRAERDGETLIEKITAKMFYRVIQYMSRIKIPEDTGDFRLLSRRSVNALKKLREHHRFMKGIFAWIGYLKTSILYRRDRRYSGKSKWNYWHLWNFACHSSPAIV